MIRYLPSLLIVVLSVVASVRRAETAPETGRGGHGWPACSTGQVGPAVTVPCTIPYAAGTDVRVVAADPHPDARGVTVMATTRIPDRLIALLDASDPAEVPAKPGVPERRVEADLSWVHRQNECISTDRRRASQDRPLPSSDVEEARKESLSRVVDE